MRRTLLLPAAGLLLLLATAGCGGGSRPSGTSMVPAEGSVSPGPVTPGAVDPAAGPASSVPSPLRAGADAPPGGGQGEAEAEEPGEGACDSDSARLSGSSTVLWTADPATGKNAADAAPDAGMTFQPDGSLEPSTITVDAGQVFAVRGGDSEHAVRIGCADAQTAGPGGPAGFVITAPGAYPVVDETANDFAGRNVGTILVE